MQTSHARDLHRPALWDAVSAYENPYVVWHFAEKHDVSVTDAEDLFREMKRFLYLGYVLGMPCSPSKAVDEMWHEFITHTAAYMDFCGDHFLFRTIVDKLLYPFEIHPTAKTMLDVGCGKGIVSVYAAAKGLTVDAVDKAPEPPPLFRNIPNIHFVSADLGQWVPTRSYDIILCHYVLHFLERTYVIRDFLPTLVNHLNPHGVLQLLVFTPQDFTSVPTKFSPEELLPIFRNLDILKNETFIEQEDHPPIGKHEHHTLHLVVRA